jgi:hypothetical protein
VAPSLIPKKRGERVKTDRPDAHSRARLHRTGEMTVLTRKGPSIRKLKFDIKGMINVFRNPKYRVLMEAEFGALNLRPLARHAVHVKHIWRGDQFTAFTRAVR